MRYRCLLAVACLVGVEATAVGGCWEKYNPECSSVFGPTALCSDQPCTAGYDGSLRCSEGPASGRLAFSKEIAAAIPVPYSPTGGNNMTVDTSETVCAMTFTCTYGPCEEGPDGSGPISCEVNFESFDPETYYKQIITGQCEPPNPPQQNFPGRQ